MSMRDHLCWRMGKLGGVGVDPKFEMRRRSESKKKDHGYAEGIEWRENTNVERTLGVGLGPAMISADEGGVVDAASEPGSGIQGGAGPAVPCRLNAAGWVTVDLRRVMVSVMKVYR